MNAGAIIVAGGAGVRMGGPKQFLPLLGRPMVEWTLAAFLELPGVREVVLVLAPDAAREHGSRLSSGRVRVTSGGATRMLSVRSGFAALSEGVEVVAVHDGARPLVSRELVEATLEEARASGAAVPAVPVKDTLKTAEDGRWISSTPERSSFWLAQTPQCYRRAVLAEALARFPTENGATDESQLVERAGHKVRLVPAAYENIKVTTPEDLAVAEALLERRVPGLRPQSRCGFGFDIHRLVPGRELWLGGLRFEHPKGLLGHSDGDAALHAACDAALGAAGLGEIGMMFPPEDPRFRGLASREIAAETLRRLRERGAVLASLDITLVAEEPQLRPHYPALRRSVAGIFELEEGAVSLKAKSHEGLGEIGRGEAIACYAVASVLLACPAARRP